MFRTHFKSSCLCSVGCTSSVCVSDDMLVLYHASCLSIFSVDFHFLILICLIEQKYLVLTNSALLTIFPLQVIYFVFYLKHNFQIQSHPDFLSSLIFKEFYGFVSIVLCLSELLL